METLSTNKIFDGVQGVYRHLSALTGVEMNFSIYLPPQAQAGARLPILWYLSGLTCTHAQVTEKGGFQRVCAELGVIFVAPDTSPRGDFVADAEGWDFGQGASFYVDATEAPFSRHYRMYSYLVDELPGFIADAFPADLDRQAITGHSMGGHGALVLGLRNPERFRGISAFAPIVAPSRVPWGEKAFDGYLGGDKAKWRAYDAVALIEDGARVGELLVDQGTDDQFLEKQLCPELLSRACLDAGIPLELRMRKGYDHSYYFISTFMEDHVRWHASRLLG